MKVSAILSLRLQGHTLDQIGQSMDPPAIWKLLRRALANMLTEPFEQLRLLELMRLDEMMAAIYPAALGGDVAAVDRVLGVQARRARLIGLDMQPARYGDSYDERPKVRVEIIGSPDPEHVHRLEEQLRLRSHLGQ
jgi:hypothetical protein